MSVPSTAPQRAVADEVAGPYRLSLPGGPGGCRARRAGKCHSNTARCLQSLVVERRSGDSGCQELGRSHGLVAATETLSSLMHRLRTLVPLHLNCMNALTLENSHAICNS